MSRSIRVLVTLGGIPLFGQERGNIEVFRALESRGVEALFVTNEAYGHEAIQPALDALGLRWTTAPYTHRWGRITRIRQIHSRLRSGAALARAFARIARTYQPTHVHTMNEQHALIAVPLFRALRLPLVYRVGDEPRQHHPVYRWIWRRVFAPHVDQFVAISGFIRDRLVAAGVPEHKIKVIYNLPPNRTSLCDTTDLPSDLLAPYSGRTVVYMGQISAAKGVDLLVEAAVRMCSAREDIRFLLAGDYSYRNPFAETLITRVDALGLSDRIRFLSHVEDVPGLLALADVHATPSVSQEALSNVVGEAKQAGVPSVVFPSGGLPELVVDDGKDALVCQAPTTDALLDGLLHYVSMSDAQLEDASRAARSSLIQLGITFEAFADAWSAVYASP